MTLYAFETHEPQLPDDGDFWIAPDAYVSGKVVLRSGAAVWFCATLRGDNEVIEIGDGERVRGALQRVHGGASRGRTAPTPTIRL